MIRDAVFHAMLSLLVLAALVPSVAAQGTETPETQVAPGTRLEPPAAPDGATGGGRAGAAVDANAEGAQRTPALRGGARIVVFDIENRTTDERWARLASQMSAALRLTLEIDGRYLLVDPGRRDGGVDLARIVAEVDAEGAVTGRITNAPGGRLSIGLDALDARSRESIFTIRREAFGEFDVIAAADEVVLEAAERLLGYPIDFGVVLLEPEVGGVDYRVELDGVPVGDEIAAIPRVPSGRRRIEIFVVTPFGERIAHAEEYEVGPEEAVTVRFPIPSEALRADLEIEARLAIAEGLLGQAERAATANRALAEARTLLEGTGAAEQDALTARIALLEGIWRHDDRFARLVPARFTPQAGPLPAPPERGAESFSPAEPATRRAERNLIAWCELARLRWMAELLAGDHVRAAEILSEREACEAAASGAVRASLAEERAFMVELAGVADSLVARAGRPWPWLLLGGSVAAGGYAGAIGTGLIDSPVDLPDNPDWVPAEVRDIVPWVPVGVATLVAVGSAVRAIRNRRAAPVYVARTARRTYPELAERADGLLSDAGQGVPVLLAGSPETVVTLGGAAIRLPAVVRAEPGRPLAVQGPFLVAEDQNRIVGTDGAVFVFR